jgi:hypothetical protein
MKYFLITAAALFIALKVGLFALTFVAGIIGAGNAILLTVVVLFAAMLAWMQADYAAKKKAWEARENKDVVAN